MSHRVARLNVKGGRGSWGLSTNKFEHRLGYKNSSMYQLEQPFDPDDRWYIEPLPGGALMSSRPDPSLPHAFEDDYRAWAGRPGHNGGAAVLALLPSGENLVVRSARQPSTATRVALGNDLVEAAPNIQGLVDEPPFHANVVGPDPEATPDVSQPLIGVAILEYTSNASSCGVLFFQCTEPPTTRTAGDGAPVLVIPRSGPLLIDGAAHFGGHDIEAAHRLWKTDVVLQFATMCTGEKLPP